MRHCGVVLSCRTFNNNNRCLLTGLTTAVQYEVHVHTGDRWAAATDANVFIQLAGSDDISERLPLLQSNSKTKFVRNQVAYSCGA